MSNHENTPGLTLGDSRRFIALDGEELSGFVVEVSGFGYVFATESGENHSVPFANVIEPAPDPEPEVQNHADQDHSDGVEPEVIIQAEEVATKEPDPAPLLHPVERIELHQPISVSQSIQPPAQDPETQRASLDMLLINAGFDPGIDYIRANYGEHWNKRETPPESTPEPQQNIDLSPVVDGFRAAVSELMQAHSAQLSGLAMAVSTLAEKRAESESIQHALIAALNEARKPVEINMKLEMPEQRAKRFVADRDEGGRMVLTEMPAATQKSLN